MKNDVKKPTARIPNKLQKKEPENPVKYWNHQLMEPSINCDLNRAGSTAC
jgi:hypothetical protein